MSVGMRRRHPKNPAITRQKWVCFGDFDSNEVSRWVRFVTNSVAGDFAQRAGRPSTDVLRWVRFASVDQSA